MAQINRDFFTAQYREEVNDHIQRITQYLFRLEEEPGNAGQILEEVFRIAHTLKGSSRMMGYSDLSTLAHKMEDLLVELRDGHLALSPTVTDLLFYYLDTITYLIEGIAKDIKRSANLEHFDDLFNAILAGDEIEVPHVQPKPLKGAPPSKEEQAPAPPAVQPERLETTEERQYIRIHTSDLDSMLNLVGELIINQYRYEGQWTNYQELLLQLKEHQQQLAQLHEQILDIGEHRETPGLTDLSNHLERSAFDITQSTKALIKKSRTDVQQMRLSIDKLQEQVIDIRMIPASRVFDLFPRLVRMTARRLGKKVSLSLQGEDTKIDSRIIEEMRDPLIHLLQNAIHHGIESPERRQNVGKDPTGRLQISAQQEGNRILIKIKDDGQGIKTQQIRRLVVEEGLLSRQKAEAFNEQELFELLFHPGFSTSDTVDDIAGRGFGLNIVRAHVDRVQGEIEVNSAPGQGCEFILKLPLTLTIMNALLVRVVDQVFAIPTMAIETTFDVTPERIEIVGQNPFVLVDGTLIPLVELRQILETNAGREEQPLTFFKEHPQKTVIVIQAEDRRIGFLVDDLVEEREIVIKSLGPCLKRVRNVAGATTVRGEVVIILFVRDMVRSADALFEGKELQLKLSRTGTPDSQSSQLRSGNIVPRILLVDDSPNTREVERTMLEKAGYEVLTAEHGKQGLDLLTRYSVDLLITDVEMPEMDGLTLTRSLKEQEKFQTLPIIIVSTKGDAEDRRQGLNAGADAYIVKGEFDEKNLLETVDSCLRSAGSVQ